MNNSFTVRTAITAVEKAASGALDYTAWMLLFQQLDRQGSPPDIAPPASKHIVSTCATLVPLRAFPNSTKTALPCP